jgi:hypothetical protein
MNHRSDIDRVMKVWMDDGPTAIPDRVVDVVAARIGVQRQRRAWPFPGRTTVTAPMKLAAGLAAVLVAAVVGLQMLPGNGGTGGEPTASPSATPAPSPTAAPTPKPVPTSRTITYPSFGSAPSLDITFDLPAGWGEFDTGWLVGPENRARAMVLILETAGLFSDPCQWDIAGTGDETQPGDLAVSADALELATALHDHTAYTSAGAPTPTSLGSHAGYFVEIELPADLDFVGPTCDVVTGDQDGNYVVFGAFHFYPQGPSNRWQISIVDVDDVQLAVILSSFAETSEEDMAAARSIVDSIQISQ